jgi:replicative DNA helicase
MMSDPIAANTALDVIRAEDFSDPRNGALFRVLASLYPSCPGLDVVVVTDHIKTTGQEAAVGGSSRIGGLLGVGAEPESMRAHCVLLRDKHQRRRLLGAASEIAHIAKTAPAGDISAAALDAIEDAIMQDKTDSPVSMQAIANPIIEDVLAGEPRETWGIPTGIGGGAFDELTGGIQAGQFWVLGAVPSMGKSTLVAAITQSVVGKGCGEPLFLSTEMGPAAMARFVIANCASLHTNALRKRNLTDHQRKRVEAVRDGSPLRNFYFSYVPGKTVGQIRRIARAHARRHGLPLLIIDLASGLSADGEHGENARISNILRGLVSIKEDLNCCLIACAHLSRAVAMSEGRRPQLYHLRDSGEWEQHADRVLFLHRESYWDAVKSSVTEIIQAKDREDGHIGSCFLEWKKATRQYERAERPCKDDDGGPPRY